ncbi:hypothetical protein FJP64_21875 [Kosakonia cowanii]|uniref:hypothetical protein n=1 Tax=Kosakonia cowanii TaxID=208223 RepID=UPI00111D96ED|nr:hypothetical protein [Kosakonia cowanii]MDP9770682.1 hypothetical protein [Atlantibacter hermannii]TPD59928.1 hypothetical protein FJP70_21850 [Kosakonia cowanii]TPD83372.1 hypothetical protein FJP67_21845 [Kosakonia cowanii]TPE00754.1 hypothetical protein FJP64_21875 [Kosakonia cowanii]
MTRIGILELNEPTEAFLSALFSIAPDAQVFLTHTDAEQANFLARKFPCWILNDTQSVVDESDIILTTLSRNSTDNIGSDIKYRATQLVLLLDSRPSFIDGKGFTQGINTTDIINRQVVLQNISPGFHLSHEQLDNHLLILRVLLLSMKSVHSLEINVQALF